MLRNATKSLLQTAKGAGINSLSSVESCSSTQIRNVLVPGQATATSHGTADGPQSGLPFVARALGYAGAIPFIALSPPVANMVAALPPSLASNAALLQVGYGASIASFLGGIHWAMAMAEYGGAEASAEAVTARYVWSVTPCLLAWPAIALPPGPGSLLAASTLGLAYAVDRRFAAKGLLPPWYMSLRLPLTAAASGAYS